MLVLAVVGIKIERSPAGFLLSIGRIEADTGPGFGLLDYRGPSPARVLSALRQCGAFVNRACPFLSLHTFKKCDNGLSLSMCSHKQRKSPSLQIKSARFAWLILKEWFASIGSRNGLNRLTVGPLLLRESFPARGFPLPVTPAGVLRACARPLASRARGIVAQSARFPSRTKTPLVTVIPPSLASGELD